VYKRSSTYSSRQDLNKLIDKKEPFVIIFAADWCKACSMTKRALKKIIINKKVLFLNADEDWVRSLMAVMKINSIPTMIGTDKQGNIISRSSGAGEIITYLLISE